MQRFAISYMLGSISISFYSMHDVTNRCSRPNDLEGIGMIMDLRRPLYKN